MKTPVNLLPLPHFGGQIKIHHPLWSSTSTPAGAILKFNESLGVYSFLLSSFFCFPPTHFLSLILHWRHWRRERELPRISGFRSPIANPILTVLLALAIRSGSHHFLSVIHEIDQRIQTWSSSVRRWSIISIFLLIFFLRAINFLPHLVLSDVSMFC